MLNKLQTPARISDFEKWMITITVMLVAVVEVLDMTIVNVALPPMMGSLGASSDQVTWILTSYIVSSAIFMLLTGFLVNQLGRRKLLLINIIGFLAASMLCGISTSLPEMVFFRTLQGIFGASLVPLSQLILRTTYPKEEIGKAMAIWGVGIMVAPVIGPTLGGYITDNLTWRWIFYLNLPVCIIAFFMTLQFIKETPIVKQAVDWLGMFLMALGVGTLQIFLDRGNSDGWFNSHLICMLAITSVISLSWFIRHNFRQSNNIVDLSVYKDKNFATSCFLLLLFSSTMLGLLSIQPILLENIIGFPTETTGLIMGPRGVASAIGMVLSSILLKRFDARKIMFVGILLSLMGTYEMCFYNIVTEQKYWMLSGAIQGLGMGLFFVPLSAVCFNTLKPEQIPAAAGLFSFARNIGISIGISIFSTIITRQTQINWNRLGGHIQPYNSNLYLWLQQHNWQLQQPVAINELATQLANQAGMIAFINSFWLMVVCLIIILPVIFIMQKPKASSEQPVVH